MTTELDPIALAGHIPYVLRNLGLERRPVMAKTLLTLGRRQVESAGAPVRMSRGVLRGDGFTEGEGGRVYETLRELEKHGVVVRFKAASSRGHSWSLWGSIDDWHSMPWIWGGAVVARGIRGCILRAACPFSARLPGQSVVSPRGEAEIALSAADHLLRPGLFLVETRGERERRAEMADARAWQPVETRGDGGDRPPLVLSVEEDSRLLRLEEEERVFRRLCDELKRRSGAPRIFGAPADRLRWIARQPPPRVGAFLDAMGRTSSRGLLEILDEATELLEAPARSASRSPASERAAEDLRRLEGNLRAEELAGYDIGPDRYAEVDQARARATEAMAFDPEPA